MIAIARKNFFSNPNSFLCNSNVHLLLSIHPFSTSRIKRLIIPSPEICDVLVNKHHFSPELASLASSRFPKFRSPKRADSVLSFLKENSFTTAQLQKMVRSNPRILGFSIESLKLRFKVFQDLGLSPEDIAKMLSSHQSILGASVAKMIIPSLSILMGLLGSNEEVARLLRKSVWFLYTDLKNTLIPNMEILKGCGVSMERILGLLYHRQMLIKPDVMRKSVDRAIEFGFSPTSFNFISAAFVFCCTSEGMWEVKLQTLRDLGFSNDDIYAMFRKQPKAFTLSAKKMKNVIEYLLATGKYNTSNIVCYPLSLGCSIERRLEPRLQILGLLESRNLIQKWPRLPTVALLTDDKFFDIVIRPYYDEIGEELITKIYGEGRGR